MKIMESYPGEFDSLSHEDLEEKLHKAISSLGKHTRGGELQLIADLSDEMSAKYMDRMEQMLTDFAELEAQGEI